MNRRWHWALPLLLLIIGAMFVAACGGDDDDAGDDGGATATATRDSSDATGRADEPTDAPDDGGDPTDEPDQGSTVADACAVVTQAEAEAALGTAIQTPYITFSGTAGVGLSGAMAETSTCAYMPDAGVPSANVNLWSSPGNAADVRSALAEASCAGKETIDDLGDIACWYDDQRREIMLAVGSNWVDIFVTMEDAGDATDPLLAFAEAAERNLS